MPKLSVFIFLIFISPLYKVFSQDLFSSENSKQFSEYLLKSGQFEIASKELERLVFLDPQNDSLKLNLIKSYRLSKKIDLGILRTQQMYSEIYNLPYPMAIEYSKLLMEKRDWEASESFWKESKNINNDDKLLLSATLAIFDNSFKIAKTKLDKIEKKDNPLVAEYMELLEKGQKQNLKSPALAGILSTVLPGSGKFYSKNWKDGLISFVFISALSFNSYRNFNKHGVNNYRGWLNSGLATGFYLGNIYGSVKSTKDFNKKKINILQHEASNYFNSYY